MRDHRKLLAFARARELALEVYRATSTFPQLAFLGENGRLIGLSQEVARLVAGLANSLANVPSRDGSCKNAGSHPLRTED
jgi:hypothetical protein